MTKRRYPLSLLEVVIGIVLLGIVLTALFQFYRQTVKTNSAVKTVKQTVQQIEIFNQRVRSILTPSGHTKVWLQTHPDAAGLALMVHFEQPIDRDPLFCGEMQGMLFLDAQHRLSFVTWGKNNQSRMEVLLDNVPSIEYHLFDEEAAKWIREWPEKKKENPVMVKMIIKHQKREIPFVYFLDAPSNPIVFEN